METQFVYILMRGVGYEGSAVIGVYTDRNVAERAEKEYNRSGGLKHYEGCWINEHTVNQPPEYCDTPA